MRASAFPASVAAALLVSAFAGPAAAYYEESHVTGDDVRITVDAKGSARVEHTLTWRIVAGKPRAFDLAGTEASAVVDSIATAEAEDGRSLAASVVTVPGHGLHVTFLEPKALSHGQSYTVHVAYAVDLVAEGELARDGSAVRISWKSPLPNEGLEDARVTFLVPPAVDPPTAFIGEGGMADDGVVSTLKREPGHDEVSLLRPHIGRGEEVVWALRVSPHAFDANASPALAPPPPPPRHDAPAGAGAFAYVIAAGLALLLALLVRSRDQRFLALARSHRISPRGLVPLGSLERAATVGASFFVGLSLQLIDVQMGGAIALVVAMAAGVLVVPRVTEPARGPGRWLVLRPEEAFAKGTQRFDLQGMGLWVGVIASWAMAARFLAASHPEAPRALAMDAFVLLPLLMTGRASQLPPDRARDRASWLSRVHAKLRPFKALRVAPWARVPTGQVRPDEVRVLVLPRAPMPGLTGIEIGVAWGRASTSFVATPEVLIRVQEATPASARLTGLASGVIPVPGRRPDERVYRMAPSFPSLRATVALARSLADRLIDRRQGEASFSGEDRRAPPPLRDEVDTPSCIPVLG